ncbi:hypothetical protein BD408DRAFT_436064 [Parasitella parasitica]|nr:hypothetical protein BD408DRAFT_436064 [Parasitella parasitica]
MVTTKPSGGLGVIDIYAQQKALYYRWLDPVLFDRPHPPAISNYVRVQIQYQLETEVLDIGLLFPVARSTTPFGALTSTTTMLFRTMDAIPRLKALKISDIFELQVITGLFLTPTPIDRIPCDLKIVTRKLYNALARADCLFAPFFRACL